MGVVVVGNVEELKLFDGGTLNMSDSRVINSWLKRQGKNLYGEPLWQLVFSDNQSEVRCGTFNEFHGDIFLGTFTGHKECPKYPYIHQRWILERWCPPEVACHKELPHTRRGSYEPVFVFEDKNGNPLPLSLRVVELIVNFADEPRETSQAIASRIKSDEDSREKRELEELLASIGE